MTQADFPRLNVSDHALERGTIEVAARIAVIHIILILEHPMLFCEIPEHEFLRRDLSRSVFVKQCAIRIDKQQKERYNNVVIDNDVII